MCVLKQTLMVIFMFFIVPNNSQAIIHTYTFAGLVNNAPVIALGSISVNNDTTAAFSVQMVFKGDIKQKNLVIDTKGYDVILTHTKRAIVFFNQPTPEGRIKLFADDDQCIWPRTPKSSNLFLPTLKRIDIDAVTSMTVSLIMIDKSNNIETKLKMIREWLNSSNKAMQTVAVEYLYEEQMWPRKPGTNTISATYDERVNALDSCTDDLLRVVNEKKNEEHTRAIAIRSLKYASLEKIRPLLEKARNDENEYVREAAYQALSNHVRVKK